MKKRFSLLMLVASLSSGLYAQGEMDAFNLSYNDLTGTARSVSMGGAFGALGGDISGIAINPAGIGIYTKSEIVGSVNFTNNQAKTNLYGNQNKDSKFKVSFDNLAFVGTIPTMSDVAPLINFGFSYNRLKSFDRNVKLTGNNLTNSQTNYIANRVSGISNTYLGLGNNPFNEGTNYWLGGLTYNTGLIRNTTGTNDKYTSSFFDFANPNLDSRLQMREKGSIDTYEFNAGTTFLDMISAGVSVSVTDINYRMYSTYTEEWYNADTYKGGYDLQNWLNTDGTGWQVKAGLIFKPIHELRIGVAYHSPTWYNLTDSYSARIESNVSRTQPIVVDSWDYTNNGSAYSDYKLRTPDKWVFSLAGVIGQNFILSADYELTNYKNMQLKSPNGEPYFETNTFIKQDFKNASTLRLGAEARITPQFSARIGYMWQQSPVQKSFKDSNDAAASSTTDVTTAATERTVTQYSLVGDANYFTWGLGYRITKNFYTDVAFVIKERKDDLYNYGGANKAELKNNLFSGVLTLGYKF